MRLTSRIHREMGMSRYCAFDYHVHSFRLCYDVHAQENRILAWSHPCNQVASIQSSHVHTARLHPYLIISVQPERVHTNQSYPYERVTSMPDHLHIIRAYPRVHASMQSTHVLMRGVHPCLTTSIQSESVHTPSHILMRGLRPCPDHIHTTRTRSMQATSMLSGTSM